MMRQAVFSNYEAFFKIQPANKKLFLVKVSCVYYTTYKKRFRELIAIE
jgi:hypothetical protein